MTEKQTHIIQKVNIDIDVPDLKTARHIYQNFSTIWSERILPLLEKRLQPHTSESVARFDKLSFEFESLSVNDLEELLDSQLSDELIKVTGNKNSIVISQEQKNKLEKVDEKKSQPETQEIIVDSFIYFLHYGQKPWYISENTVWPNEEAIKEALSKPNRKIQATLLKNFAENKTLIDRLFYQFSDSFCIFIVEFLTGIRNTELNSLTDDLVPQQSFKPIIKKLLKEFIKASATLSFYENKNILVSELKEKIIASRNELEIPEQNSLGDKEKAKKDYTNENPDACNAIYVTLAGSILVHPFLHYYFKEFELVDDEDFISEQARETAIHLLYFLVTGKQNPYEHELVFIKHLCGWPRFMPVDRFVTLTEEMKTESVQLLNSVIRHWKVLKNTSPDGLRESFLNRNGKLILADHQHKLIMEKNTIDILLEHIPWNHSIISLPWMKNILYAEW